MRKFMINSCEVLFKLGIQEMNKYTEYLSNIVERLYDDDFCEVKDDVCMLSAFLYKLKIPEDNISEADNFIILSQQDVKDILVSQMGRPVSEVPTFWSLARKL